MLINSRLCLVVMEWEKWMCERNFNVILHHINTKISNILIFTLQIMKVHYYTPQKSSNYQLFEIDIFINFVVFLSLI